MFTRLYVINGYLDDFKLRVKKGRYFKNSLFKTKSTFDLKRAIMHKSQMCDTVVNLIFLLCLLLENIVVGLFQSVPFLLPADPPYWTHHSCRAEVVLWLAQPAHARDAASLCALVVASYPVQRCNYNLCPLHSCSNALRMPPRGSCI